VLSSFVEDIKKLDYYTFGYFDLFGARVLISRTGYTGELGYEIYCPWEMTRDFWRKLMKDGRVQPAGLGARDVLRLEMGYSLYGHELSEDVSPLESGLNRFVCFEKDFIGKNVLLKQKDDGLKKKIVGIVSQTRRAPREGHKIYFESGEEIGMITSGTFSPALNKGIALGFVATAYAGQGSEVLFGDEKSKNKGIISSRFFYHGGSLKE